MSRVRGAPRRGDRSERVRRGADPAELDMNFVYGGTGQ
jgi:hypothetical protein